jgi:hypothetical protein
MVGHSRLLAAQVAALAISGVLCSAQEPTPDIRGNLVFGDQAAVAHKARVLLWRVSFETDQSFLIRDVAVAPDGVFRFDVPQIPADRWGREALVLVALSSKEFVAAAELRGSEEVREGIVLQMHAQSTIRGFVSDDRGTPIENAQVSIESLGPVSNWDTLPQWRTRTNTKGRFEISAVPAGLPCRIGVEHPDYLWACHDGPPGSEDVVLVLERGGKIAGRVLLPDGRPAVGVRVGCQATNNYGSGEARTDANGCYALDSLAPNSYFVWATTSDLTSVAIQTDEVMVRDVTQAKPLTLTPGVMAKGRLVDSRTGKRVTGRCGSLGIWGPGRPGIPAPGGGVWYGQQLLVELDGSFTVRLPAGRSVLAMSMAYLTDWDLQKDVTIDAEAGRDMAFDVPVVRKMLPDPIRAAVATTNK